MVYFVRRTLLFIIFDNRKRAKNQFKAKTMDKEQIEKDTENKVETDEPIETVSVSIDPAEFKQDDTPFWEQVKASVEAYAPQRKKGFKFGCYRFFKRTFDIFASLIALILLSPVFLILAILVKCSDGGKVFYKHKRVGLNGKAIYVTKFRSMRKDADKLFHLLTPEQIEQYKREFKIDNDPRITKIGKFLRRSSLDELPQLWDIFVGKISVVGVRPLVAKEIIEKYGEETGKLISIKPGMIGWWAANGRSNCTYESGKRQELELYYVEHCSIGLDIKTVFKTIFGVLKREGAK